MLNIIPNISIDSIVGIYMIGQSVNCFKSDFITLTGLKVEDSNEQKLSQLCHYFKDKLNDNELDGKIEKDEYGLLKLDDEVKQEEIDNMKNLGKNYPCLQGFYPNPKSYYKK